MTLAESPKLPSIFSRELSINFSYIHILFIIAIIPSIFLENSSLKSFQTLTAWLIVKALALTVTFSIWWIGNFLFLKLGIKITFLVAGLIGALGAGISSALVTNMAEVLNLTDQIPIQKRIIGALIIGGLWLPIYSIAISNFLDFRQIESELLKDIDSQEQIRFKQSTFFYLIRTKAQESIQERLRVTSLESQLMLQQFVDNGKNLNQLPEVVRELASGSFRAISHELIEESKALRTSRSFLKNKSLRGRLSSLRSLALFGLRNDFLKPALFTYLTSLFTTGILLRHESTTGIVLVTANNFILSFLTLKAAPLIATKTKRINRTLLNLFTIFFLIIVPLCGVKILAQSGFIDIFEKGYNFYYWLYSVLVLVTVLTLNIIQSSLVSNQELKNELKETLRLQSIKEAIISNEITRISEKWAQHIHGRLQSDLVVQAHRLQLAQESNNSDEIESSIANILSILRNPEFGIDILTLQFHEELAKRKELWLSLVEVEFESSLSDDEVRPAETVAIGECVEEMISNAARHGKANKIEIEISRRDFRTILISALDDGIGMVSPKPGLGFHLFDHISRGNWATSKDESTGKNKVMVFIDTTALLDAYSEGQISQP